MKKNSKFKLAHVYAQAMYEAALEGGAEDVVFADMQKLAALVAEDGDIVKYLSNPLWDVKDKKKAVVEIAKKSGLTPLSLNCLTIIAENNRFADLAFILQEFEKIYYLEKNIAEVEVESAIELSEQQDETLKNRLEQVLNRKVVIKYKIKPEILGGLLIQCGSKMMDDSIKGKIERLEFLMKGLK